MHRVMNELYNMTSKNTICSRDEVTKALDNILRNGNESYSTIFYQMTERQRELLLALAKEGKTAEINGADFVSRNGLKSQSAVASAAKTLIKKDIITREGNEYYVYDHFFSLWLRKLLGLPPEE